MRARMVVVPLVVAAWAGSARAGEADAASVAPLDFNLLADADTTVLAAAQPEETQESAQTRRTMGLSPRRAWSCAQTATGARGADRRRRVTWRPSFF